MADIISLETMFQEDDTSQLAVTRNGQPLAVMIITVKDEGKTLYVENVETVDLGGDIAEMPDAARFSEDAVRSAYKRAENTLGHRAISDMLVELSRMFPAATQVGGFRIGGARTMGGYIGAETMVPLGSEYKRAERDLSKFMRDIELDAILELVD